MPKGSDVVGGDDVCIRVPDAVSGFAKEALEAAIDDDIRRDLATVDVACACADKTRLMTTAAKQTSGPAKEESRVVMADDYGVGNGCL